MKHQGLTPFALLSIGMLLAGCSSNNNPSVPFAPGPSIIRINAGGLAYTDSQGRAWEADTDYSGGGALSVTGSIANTSDPALYRTERNITVAPGYFDYSLPVNSATYQVTLKFAEIYSGITGSGQRVFNVSVNGVTVLNNFDIYAAVGPNTAVDEVVRDVTPVNGAISIRVGPASANNPKISAIEVIPQTHPYATQWNSGFSAQEKVSVGKGGLIYVSGDNSIEEFTSDGIAVTSWGQYGDYSNPVSAALGPGYFNGPSGMAADGSGNIYVADSGNGRIQKSTSAGIPITMWGQYGDYSNPVSAALGPGYFNQPTAVAVDGNGNVYVADTDNHRIQEFTSNGASITMWGQNGAAAGQFSYPSGVAVDGGGNVYIADNGNDRVQKFTSSGTFVGQWGQYGTTGAGYFNGALEVAVDGNRNVYVDDYLNYRIQEFDSSGHFEQLWGSLGTGNEQFTNLFGVAADGAGNVYAADNYSHRIQKFGP